VKILDAFVLPMGIVNCCWKGCDWGVGVRVGRGVAVTGGVAVGSGVWTAVGVAVGITVRVTVGMAAAVDVAAWAVAVWATAVSAVEAAVSVAAAAVLVAPMLIVGVAVETIGMSGTIPSESPPSAPALREVTKETARMATSSTTAAGRRSIGRCGMSISGY
jgi:hypothetical protein